MGKRKPEPVVDEAACLEVIRQVSSGVKFREAAPRGLDYREVWVMIQARPDLSRLMADAKRQAAELLVEEAMRIADGPAGTKDYVKTRRIMEPDGTLVRIIEDRFPNVERDRLRVQVRQWLASKMAPEDFGEAVTLRGDRDNPPEFVFRVVGPTPPEPQKVLPAADMIPEKTGSQSASD